MIEVKNSYYLLIQQMFMGCLLYARHVLSAENNMINQTEQISDLCPKERNRK